MYPTLFQLGSLPISSFGFFMALALVSASFLVWREARKEYLDEEKVMDIFLLSAFIGIVGARLSYILLYPAKFGFNILRWFLPSWVPGFYIYGGLIVAFLTVYTISQQKEIEFKKFLDAAIAAVVFAALLYKVGQFFDGSLVGIATKSFYGLPVVGESGMFIPVALIEAFLFLVIYIILVKLRRYFVVERKIAGALFLAGVVLVSFSQILIYPLLSTKTYLNFLPISLIIAAIAFFVSSFLLYKKTRNFKEDIKKLHLFFLILSKKISSLIKRKK